MKKQLFKENKEIEKWYIKVTIIHRKDSFVIMCLQTTDHKTNVSSN